jgi:hypoxanthine phosphoribosyltransferase
MTPTTSVESPPSGHLPCRLVSFGEVYRLSRRVSLDIIQSGYRPDIIVAIARGGFVPARILADFLKVPDLTSLRIVHYGAGAAREKRAHIRYPLPIDVSGLRVLVVDDLTDSGETLQAAMDHLLADYLPAEARTAALHYKHNSSFRPDYFARRSMRWRWLIYPWAVMEDVGAFAERMEGFPLPIEEVAVRLEQQYQLVLAEPVLQDVLALLQKPRTRRRTRVISEEPGDP